MPMPNALATPPMTIRHNVLQGECEVSGDPQLVLTTILGSCIACCLFDPVARLGGMNHFLLASPPLPGQFQCGDAQRYGQFAMEFLVNEMLKRGAEKASLRAHLYGGANILSGMRAIGSENAEFAEDFLRADGIQLVHANTGGEQARRVDLQPASGRVRCSSIRDEFPQALQTRVPMTVGDVELFWEKDA